MALTMNETMNAETDSRLLRLSALDNVFTAIASLEPGEIVRINGQPMVLSTRVPFGHKLAARQIIAGEKVIKYGVSIGSATRLIQAGDLVHTHNLKSDYLPTWQHGNQEKYFNLNR
jgi:altronate dehydratase small subunit